jgi:hypothetical protein
MHTLDIFVFSGLADGAARLSCRNLSAYVHVYMCIRTSRHEAGFYSATPRSNSPKTTRSDEQHASEHQRAPGAQEHQRLLSGTSYLPWARRPAILYSLVFAMLTSDLGEAFTSGRTTLCRSRTLTWHVPFCFVQSRTPTASPHLRCCEDQAQRLLIARSHFIVLDERKKGSLATVASYLHHRSLTSIHGARLANIPCAMSYIASVWPPSSHTAAAPRDRMIQPCPAVASAQSSSRVLTCAPGTASLRRPLRNVSKRYQGFLRLLLLLPPALRYKNKGIYGHVPIRTSTYLARPPVTVPPPRVSSHLSQPALVTLPSLPKSGLALFIFWNWASLSDV